MNRRGLYLPCALNAVLLVLTAANFMAKNIPAGAAIEPTTYDIIISRAWALTGIVSLFVSFIFLKKLKEDKVLTAILLVYSSIVTLSVIALLVSYTMSLN